MSKKLTSFFLLLSLVVGMFVATTHSVLADITNPAINATLGGNANSAKAGIPFAIYFVTLWRGIITVGGLMVFIFFLWGAIEWISAGGDSGKVTKARDKITQSFIGFVLLVSTAALLAFFGKVFFGDAFDFFNLSVPVTSSATGTVTAPTTTNVPNITGNGTGFGIGP